jgi:hypothetical protein
MLHCPGHITLQKVKREILVIGIFLTFLFTTFSVQSQVSLVFLDSITKQPVEQVFVQLFNTDAFQSILDVQVSNQNGKVNFIASPDSIYFSATHLQYQLKIGKAKSKECKPCEVFLHPGTFTLSEVEITAKDHGVRVLGDTIRFDLDIFKSKSQKDLKDLLSDLPGIEIKSDGQILYNNKSIDKILLSGKDVFNSQFDMLNRLIRKELVESIQIIPGQQTTETSDAQYLDIVLSKDYETLAQLGLGLSHTKRSEQEGSLLFSGDRPIQSYINVVNRSLERPALSYGDRLRKTDFEILQARAEIYNSIRLEDLAPTIREDGNNNRDLVLQFNGQTNRKNYQANAYVDYRKYSSSVDYNSQTRNPITNQLLESLDKTQQFENEGFSAYLKQKFALGVKHNFTSFFSFDLEHESLQEEGVSSFLESPVNFITSFNINHKEISWYNNYQFLVSKRLRFEMESDVTYSNRIRNTSLQSSDSLFNFNQFEDGMFIANQNQDRADLSMVVIPRLSYDIGQGQSFTLFTQYQPTFLKDNSRVRQALNEDIFNRSTSLHFTKQITGLLYKLKAEKSELLIKPSYSSIANNSDPSFKGIFTFHARYRYNFSRYFSWINSLQRSLHRFLSEELYTSPTLLDTRNYNLYQSIELPDYEQWNVSSILRYINTANGKILLLSLSNTTSSRAMMPVITVTDNAQITQFRPGEATRQFRINGIIRWPVLNNNLTTRLDFLNSESFVENEGQIQDLTSRQIIVRSTYHWKIEEKTKVNLSGGYQFLTQQIGDLNNTFSTITPELEFQQFIAPQFWLKLHYRPIVRIDLQDQHWIDLSLTTKFFKEKLNIELLFRDILNFNNPEFIIRTINSSFIRETTTNRVGGYIFLRAGYQFQ